MPRPRKCRRICALPGCVEFGPIDAGGSQVVEMTLDEYEAIRLIDFEGQMQEACAEQMGIARTTVQAIYANARKKLAECLVLGLRLKIGGGDVELSVHQGKPCGRGCCKHAGQESERRQCSKRECGKEE